MMKDPTLKDWGKFKIHQNTVRVSASVEPDEWMRFMKFARKNNMTVADLLRAGARKILEEAKVEQPKPEKQWVPDEKESKNG